MKQQSHAQRVLSVQYSPDGSHLATGGEDGKVGAIIGAIDGVGENMEYEELILCGNIRRTHFHRDCSTMDTRWKGDTQCITRWDSTSTRHEKVRNTKAAPSVASSQIS